MRATAFLVLLLAAATATAQSPPKKACELLSAAEVEAALGTAPLRAFDPLKKGENCRFENAPGRAAFSIVVRYTDAPDPDAVLKWLKTVETTSYEKARPVAGIRDAAYVTEPFELPITGSRARRSSWERCTTKESARRSMMSRRKICSRKRPTRATFPR